jgi:hypothetical protein
MQANGRATTGSWEEALPESFAGFAASRKLLDDPALQEPPATPSHISSPIIAETFTITEGQASSKKALEAMLAHSTDMATNGKASPGDSAQRGVPPPRKDTSIHPSGPDTNDTSPIQDGRKASAEVLQALLAPFTTTAPGSQPPFDSRAPRGVGPPLEGGISTSNAPAETVVDSKADVATSLDSKANVTESPDTLLQFSAGSAIQEKQAFEAGVRRGGRPPLEGASSVTLANQDTIGNGEIFCDLDPKGFLQPSANSATPAKCSVGNGIQRGKGASGGSKWSQEDAAAGEEVPKWKENVDSLPSLENAVKQGSLSLPRQAAAASGSGQKIAEGLADDTGVTKLAVGSATLVLPPPKTAIREPERTPEICPNPHPELQPAATGKFKAPVEDSGDLFKFELTRSITPVSHVSGILST